MGNSKKLLNIILCFAAIYGILAPASAVLANAVPPNTLHIQVGSTGASDITEDVFNEILDSAIFPWLEIANNKNKNLIIEKDWQRDWVYAAAKQLDNSWIIDIKGGLARHPLMTKDGLALIVCHELGHHFGGFPFAYYWAWNSNEGQADYFATQVCAPLLWSKNILENKKFRTSVDPYAKSQCDFVWHTNESQNLCYRIAEAGKSLGSFFASLAKIPEPNLNSPDNTIINETIPGYPSPQCRLDTFFQGAICPAHFDLNIIPGADALSGKESPEAEFEAAKYSCTKSTGYSIGLRPACWYKANF